MKRICRRILGQRLIGAVTAGLETLRCYPLYLGNGLAGRLRKFDIDVTYRCNARCRMCLFYGEHTDRRRVPAVGQNRNELSTEDIRRVLEECARLGCGRVLFTGGEPLLRPDLPELVAAANNLGLNPGLNTNGLALTREIARDLVAAGLRRLAISVDGPDGVHDYIRRVPHMFARIDENVSALREEQARQGRTTPVVSVGCTISALNQHCLHELVPIAARWKTALCLSPLMFILDSKEQHCVSGPATKPEDWCVLESVREVAPKLLAREFSIVRRQCRDFGVPLYLSASTCERVLRDRYYSPSYRENNKCLYPWYGTRMNPYGDIYPCSIQSLMGNVLQEPLAAIWNSARYVAFRRSLRAHGTFAQCARCCGLSRDDWTTRLLPRFSGFVKSDEISPNQPR